MVDSENKVLIDILAELKALKAQVDESNKEVNAKLNDQATRLEKIAAEVVAQIHDANNIKVDALQNRHMKMKRRFCLSELKIN
jgi:hypothetical protein